MRKMTTALKHRGIWIITVQQCVVALRQNGEGQELAVTYRTNLWIKSILIEVIFSVLLALYNAESNGIYYPATGLEDGNSC